MKSQVIQVSCTALAVFSIFQPRLCAMAEETPTNRERLTGKRERISSDQIKESIRLDLQDAERMTSDQLKIEFAEGLVRLSGAVESIQEKHLASRIAKRTRGVQAVQNQILVKRTDRADAEIQADVEKVLRINASVDGPKIAVSVDRGEVSMLGKVDSLAEKRIAEFAASGVRGVTHVNNQMTIAISPDRTDRAIRDEVAALIIQSIYFDDLSIEVEVDDRTVVLSGSVTTLEQKDQLESLAGIRGVRSVDVSEVSVDTTSADPLKRKERYAQASDEKIAEALKRSFRNDPFLFSRSERLAADIHKGLVTLSGKVDRLFLKNRAERLAGDVIGVRNIFNRIEVTRPESPASDTELIRETQAAIARSAYLDRSEIRVHCQNAHVSLYGLVDSQLEKEVAGYLAEGVPGVVHVNNSVALDRKPSGKGDEEIEAALQRKLKHALLDKSQTIDFNVEDGVVILRGQVDTWRQWQTVMDLAIEAGAHHPHNLINVTYHPAHHPSRYFIPR